MIYDNKKKHSQPCLLFLSERTIFDFVSIVILTLLTHNTQFEGALIFSNATLTLEKYASVESVSVCRFDYHTKLYKCFCGTSFQALAAVNM